MDGDVHKKRKYQVRILAALLLLLMIDLIRGQNMVQFAYSHFQACLQEYDQSLTEFQENGDPESLKSAERAVQHVGHTDVGFLKFHCLSEPFFRKQRTILSDYLLLLTDYSEFLEKQVVWRADVGEKIVLLYEGNQEIEELLVEDSTDFDEIGISTQREVVKKINQMTEMILEEMES